MSINFNPINWFNNWFNPAPENDRDESLVENPDANVMNLDDAIPAPVHPSPLDPKFVSVRQQEEQEERAQPEMQFSEFGDHRTQTLAHLLHTTHRKAQEQARAEAASLKKKVEEISSGFTAVQNLMAELESLISQINGNDTLVVENFPNLKIALEGVREFGMDNPLLEKESFTKVEIDSLVKFLQHKSTAIQQDLTQARAHLQESVEKYNTITKMLPEFANMERNLCQKIFSKV